MYSRACRYQWKQCRHKQRNFLQYFQRKIRKTVDLQAKVCYSVLGCENNET